MADLRYKKIGGRKRAQSRYAMIRNRVNNTHRKKNQCYSGVEVRMTQEEFVTWFMERDFEGCHVDRIDSQGHYELSNLRVRDGKSHILSHKCKTLGESIICYSCGDTKPRERFVKESRRNTGYSTVCKACERKRTRGRVRRVL